MAKYKIKWEIKQQGRKTDYRIDTIESFRHPKVGETVSKLVDPPIMEIIIEVQCLCITKMICADFRQ